MSISYRSGISIAEVVLYTPAIIIAIFLTIRHGFGRSSGWRFLIIFSLARLIGSALELATISQPDNIGLWVGYMVLLTIALSPLELTAMGLLSRVISSINKTRETLVKERHVRLLQLINTVGLILSIVGGSLAGVDYGKTGHYQVHTLTKAGLGLFIASYVLIVLITIVLMPSISHAAKGEKRILIAIAISLPFIGVRLVYSAVGCFDYGNTVFNPLAGNVTVLLIMGYLAELVVVAIYEGTGLTLKRLPKERSAKGEQDSSSRTISNDHERVQLYSKMEAGYPQHREGAEQTTYGRV